ncbi:MAG: carbohydrate-binding family 6 protein, partial [Planctomycetota bacterium]|nr:carbohydrate-binding family 6 protein [Planctomycetota bacterium]
TDGKYGITPDRGNLATLDYFRKSVREMVLTYPLLAGFGITAGENMPGKDEFPLSKEQWLWKAYCEGISDALQVQPGRPIRQIHRLHQTGQKEILDTFKDYPGTFDLSYKYSVAHMYSLAAPIFARQTLAELPKDRRVWMTVRNDDIYSFRWGDPEYARAYIRAMPGPDKLAGYYMGPDGYIWGREFLSTEPDSPRQLVMKKQWYSFMMWGRLSYDPTLPDTLFARTLAVRFPEVPADKLFAACAAASKIIPQATRFFWGDIDLKWFPEACTRHPCPKGFYTVKNFIAGETMPGSGILNIRTYCDRLLAKKPMDGITPPEVAQALKGHAAATLQLLGQMPEKPADKELRLTLGDLKAMAHLGNYYAEKISGATDLAVFDRTGKAELKESAVKHLQEALSHWKASAAAATSQYRPHLLTRIGYVDLTALTEKVQQDVEMAREWKAATADSR